MKLHATCSSQPVKIPFTKLRFLAVALILCAGLGYLCIHLVAPAAAQTDNSTPYAFTTLPVKSNLENVGGTNVAAGFLELKGIAVDGAGNIFAANMRNHTICRITPAGDLSIVAGQSGRPGSEDGTGCAARFRYPQGVAVDGAGNVYVADTGNNTIRRITPAGAVTTLAGLARQAGGTDGMGTNARFNYPKGVAVDSRGNVYVAIRKVTPAGAVSTLAGLAGEYGKANGKGSQARFNFPFSVAVDGADDVYVADMLNNAIRKVTATGVVTTLAGQMTYDVGSADGPGTAAQFCHPDGLAVDIFGNVYVADVNNATIRKITPDGTVKTLAGLAGQIGSVDGAGNVARFDHPAGIALDQAGNVYVAQLGNGAIRKGVPANGALASMARPSSASFSLTTR